MPIDPKATQWQAIFRELKVPEPNHAALALAIEDLVDRVTRGELIRETRTKDVTPALVLISELAEQLAVALKSADEQSRHPSHPFLSLRLEHSNGPTPQGKDPVRYYRDEVQRLAKAARDAAKDAQTILKERGRSRGIKSSPKLRWLVERLNSQIEKHGGEVTFDIVNAKGPLLSLLDGLRPLLEPGFFPAVDKKGSPLRTYKRILGDAAKARKMGKRTRFLD